MNSPPSQLVTLDRENCRHKDIMKYYPALGERRKWGSQNKAHQMEPMLTPGISQVPSWTNYIHSNSSPEKSLSFGDLISAQVIEEIALFSLPEGRAEAQAWRQNFQGFF